MRVGVLCLVAALAAPAGAQVIEIGDDGSATVYDRPMVFTASAATPVIAVLPPVTADVSPDLADAARANGLEPGLLEAVAWRESRGRMTAVSAKGARGVMQLMPATAAALGVDPSDRLQNIHGGALYLRRQIERFGSVPLALAAYNAGPEAVRRFGGIPPFRETRAYVAAILGKWRRGRDLPPADPLLIEVPTL